MEPPLIELEDGWKKFSKTVASNRKRLSRGIVRSALGLEPFGAGLAENEYWALSGIHLALDRGQSVGLIGRNGAGKSTLLQILAGHMALDRGDLTMRGKVSELINLTAGFQPLLSGRENIKLGGLLRGLTDQQIRERTDSIIDFAEIEDFIDAPFTTYSLGMKMRLAFALNVHTDPDVLLIDEVIGVGDAAFREKCFDYLETIRSQCAIVLCTHSTGTLSRFCEFGVVLEAGQLAFAGSADDAVQLYLENYGTPRKPARLPKGPTPATIEAQSAPGTVGNAPSAAGVKDDPSPQSATFRDDAVVKSVDTRWCDTDGKPVSIYGPTDKAVLSIDAAFQASCGRDHLRFVVFLTDREGNRVGHTTVRAKPQPNQRICVTLSLDLEPLTNGFYKVELRIRRDKTYYVGSLAPLKIDRSHDSWGPIALNAEWDIQRPANPKRRMDS